MWSCQSEIIVKGYKYIDGRINGDIHRFIHILAFIGGIEDPSHIGQLLYTTSVALVIRKIDIPTSLVLIKISCFMYIRT